MLSITTAPVADGVMGVCIAGEVDMAAVTFLGSSGIWTLLQARHQAGDRGVVLRVITPSGMS